MSAVGAMLSPAEDRLRDVFDTIPTLLWSKLPDGSDELLNRPWHDYTGISPEQARGHETWKAAIHSEDLDLFIEKWNQCLAAGVGGEVEARLRRSDGNHHWFLFRFVPRRDGLGNIVRWYGTGVDIEARKSAEEKARQDEREQREIINAISQMIIVLGTDGRALYANRPVLEYTGLTLEEIRAPDSRARVFHPDDIERLREERARALVNKVPFQLEQRGLGRNGQYRWFLIQYNPLLSEQGNVAGWCASATDIEERKRTEERILKENVALREEIDRTSMFEEIVGVSESLHKAIFEVTKVARTDSTVLILGESGTGKELIARAIHRQSNRSTRAFIRVNCAAIPTSLIASELFGHEKGAFTGAAQRRLGRFESADGGTIFLDEIGELPSETQIALLRVLQEREFERVGSSRPISVDVRVIAATNRDMRAAVAAGAFRLDLFYRLNVFPLRVPSLRERVEDIPLLVEYMIERFARKTGKKIRSISRATLDLFQAYDWPGNIRELQNVVERAVILCDGDTFEIDESWLKRETPGKLGSGIPFVTAIADREKEMIEAALMECQGKISGANGAAAKLGIPRQTLDAKIATLRINKYIFKPK
jgi:formate hydrogenlyase transcriptional activator